MTESNSKMNTPCSEEIGTPDFGHNFCKCRPIFEILSLTDSYANCLCTFVDSYIENFIGSLSVGA